MSDEQRSAVTLLDCTLRDGGYYNDWDFPRALIVRYATSMADAGVPIVEIGFRTTEVDSFKGPAAYSTDSYLESLALPSGPTYAVMVNASEIVGSPDPVRTIDQLFAPRSESAIGLVRIAAHFRELDSLPPALDRLNTLGYEIGLNLMQIASRTAAEIEHFGAVATDAQVAVAYIADSFGGMHPTEVEQAIRTLSAAFDGPIGCHMHDNKSLAFANSTAAIDAGATFVDATVLGMGRGPGNAQTEYLAVELTQRGLANIDVVPLLSIVTDEFAALQQRYGWGSSVYYFLSAAHNIHPTYIQEMTKDDRYTIDEIVAAVNELGSDGGASFSRTRLESAAAESGLIDADGTWDATGWCIDRPVLIVGPGPEGANRRDDVEEYIRRARPFVIALNAIPPIDPSLVDLYAICHPVRALIDAEIINGLDGRVAMPRGVQARVSSPDAVVEFLDYGIDVRAEPMAVNPSSCALPRVSNFPYALAIATAGGAAEIQLTGFDGFQTSDPRQAEMERILRSYSELATALPVVALTPTAYSIDTRSIYAPIPAN